jgi:hypothetical protein
MAARCHFTVTDHGYAASGQPYKYVMPFSLMAAQNHKELMPAMGKSPNEESQFKPTPQGLLGRNWFDEKRNSGFDQFIESRHPRRIVIDIRCHVTNITVF